MLESSSAVRAHHRKVYAMVLGETHDSFGWPAATHDRFYCGFVGSTRLQQSVEFGLGLSFGSTVKGSGNLT